MGREVYLLNKPFLSEFDLLLGFLELGSQMSHHLFIALYIRFKPTLS